MAKLYTITETILSTGTATLESMIASSLQTWTYANEEHSQLAFTSIKDELSVAYQKGTDDEFYITHTATDHTFTITISHAEQTYETITLAYHRHDESDSITWWQTLAQKHQTAVDQFLPTLTAYEVVTKSLVSGHNPKDDDGLATSLQTWTYTVATDATTDFKLLAQELKNDYPLGVHEEGFEVVRADSSAQHALVEVTQDGDPYEVIEITHYTLEKSAQQPWWERHLQQFITKAHR